MGKRSSFNQLSYTEVSFMFPPLKLLIVSTMTGLQGRLVPESQRGELSRVGVGSREPVWVLEEGRGLQEPHEMKT